MSNEEIRESIANFQKKIEESLTEKPYTFELHPDILKYKREIDKLRAQCSHLNASNKIQTFFKEPISLILSSNLSRSAIAALRVRVR